MDSKTKQHPRSSTLQISEEDLQTSLKDFLKSDEEKEKVSIWNIRTISGLAFVFVALAFIGQTIGNEFFGSGGLTFLSTVVSITPYFAGAMVAIICIGFMKGSGKEKERKQQKEEIKRDTYDKLDEFLYSDAASDTKTSGKNKSKSSSKSSFGTKLKSSAGGLKKSRTDRKLFGVCGGIAKYLGLNSTILRIGFLIAFFLSSGSFFLLYFAMAFVMPKESIDDMDDFK